ncbi:hypothetical protein DV735_g3845, partial [Chaetothyriales sp. CBS 134920]
MTSFNPRQRPIVPEAPLDYHTPATSPSPEMLPSLAAPADWRYDRFSTVMTEFTLPTPSHLDEPLYDDSSVPELEDDDDGEADDSSGESLVETAQPVSYHLPKVRPSVISIGSRASSKEWKTLPSERELIAGSPVSRPPTRLQRRESTSSAHSGFQACEAQLMEVPDLPDTTLYMMSNTSADSFAMSQSRHWSPDLLPNTVRKPGHKRINSFKSFIRSPALSRSPSLHIQHQQPTLARPSTAVADFLDDDYNPFETVPADLNAPPVRAKGSDHSHSHNSNNNDNAIVTPHPSPSKLVTGQWTPGESPRGGFSSFETGNNDEEEQDNGKDAADDVTLEDEDFEARISRHNAHESEETPLSAANGAAGPPSSPVAAPLQRISLTSLLRPPSLLNRSTTSTRATTPDSSDVETPLDTEAAVAQSARRAHPLPPTSPKVPTYEYYGFVLYLASSLAFLIYILWSYLPSPFLHALGITYYPNRWWSLAIPAWIVMLLVYIYVALLAYNVEYLTLPLNSSECMVDEAGNVAILDSSGRIRKGGSASISDLNLSWKQIWNEGTDAVMDVPIGGVCEVLYGDG